MLFRMSLVLYLMVMGAVTDASATAKDDAPHSTEDVDQLEQRVERLERLVESLQHRVAQLQGERETPEPATDTARPASSRTIRFTAQQFEDYARQVIPHIQRINGQHFTTIPKIVVGNHDELINTLAHDLKVNVLRGQPDLTDEQALQAARDMAERMAPGILGKYGVETGKLVLMPRNLVRTLQRNKVDLSLTHDVMKILIAHELTHALQAQHMDLNGMLANRRGAEEARAYAAVVEGHAMFVQYRVAEALNLEDAAREYARTFDVTGHHAAVTADRSRRSAMLRQNFTYVQGEQFIAHHHEAGGPERMWQVLRKPPTTTRMIYRPELYDPQRMDPAQPLQRWQEHMDQLPVESVRHWSGHAHILGELDLRVAWDAMDDEAVNQITQALEYTLSYRNVDPGGDAWMTLTTMHTDGTEHSRALLEGLDRFSVISINQAREHPSVQVTAFSPMVLQGLENSDIDYHAYEIGLTDAQGNVLQDRQMVRAMLRDRVVELVIEAHHLSEAELVAMVRHAFAAPTLSTIAAAP